MESTADWLTGPLATIAQTGLLGAMFILVLVVAMRKDKDVTSAWQQRLEDSRQVQALIRDYTAAVVADASAREQIAKSMDTLARAVEKSVVLLDALAGEIREQQRVVRRR